MLAAFTLAQILRYPFPAALVRDARGTAIAYALDTQGVRTIWFARAPAWTPVQLFSSKSDDGQELTNLVISKDDAHVVYVRGGDHDANWPLPLQPGPASSPQQPEMQVWSVATGGGDAPKLLGTGDSPAISPDDTRVAFTNGGVVMIAPIDGRTSALRLFFDRGQDSDLHWAPVGSALAFVSTRTDHSFIGVYRNDATPIEYLAPTTSQDFMPRWSPGGESIAFIRLHGDGGPPQNPLNWNPVPWQIWVADVRTGGGREVWSSATSSRGSLPQTAGGPFLEWAAGDTLVFKSEENNWPQLYLVAANAGSDSPTRSAPRLLTPGNFMVEDVAISPDLQSVVYSANTGSTPGDDDRRHVFRVDVTTGGITPLTSGASSETSPVALTYGFVAFDRATAQQPLLVTVELTLLTIAQPKAWPPRQTELNGSLVPERLSFVATRNAAGNFIPRRRRLADSWPALSASRRQESIRPSSSCTVGPNARCC